jgi:hypothetical protein
MKTLRILTLLIGAMLVFATLVPVAKADPFDRKTVVTFDQDVAIPGQVLPAGTYVFKLLRTQSDRNIVQVWDGGESQLIAALLTIGDYSTEAPDNAYFVLDNNEEGYPPALVSWSYPGENTGRAFIYSGNQQQSVQYAPEQSPQ